MNRYCRILASCILCVVAIPVAAQQSKDTPSRSEPKRTVELMHEPKTDERGRQGSRERASDGQGSQQDRNGKSRESRPND